MLILQVKLVSLAYPVLVSFEQRMSETFGKGYAIKNQETDSTVTKTEKGEWRLEGGKNNNNNNKKISVCLSLAS